MEACVLHCLGPILVGKSLQLPNSNRAGAAGSTERDKLHPLAKGQVGCVRRVWAGCCNLILLARRPLLVQAGHAPRRIPIPWPEDRSDGGVSCLRRLLTSQLIGAPRQAGLDLPFTVSLVLPKAPTRLAGQDA